MKRYWIVAALGLMLIVGACSTTSTDEKPPSAPDEEPSAQAPAVEDETAAEAADEVTTSSLANLTSDRRVVRFLGESTVNYIDWDGGEQLARLEGRLQGSIRLGSIAVFESSRNNQTIVVAVDIASGTQLWSLDVSPGEVLDWERMGDLVVASAGPTDGDGNGYVFAFDEAGDVRGGMPFGQKYDEVIAASDPNARIVALRSYALDAGAVVRIETAEVLAGGPVLRIAAAGRWLAMVDDGVDVWDAVTGTAVLSLPDVEFNAFRAVDDQSAILITGPDDFQLPRTVAVLERGSVANEHAVTFDRTVIGIAAVLPNDVLVMRVVDAFQSVDLSDGSIVQSLAIPDGASVFDPDSDLLFAPTESDTPTSRATVGDRLAILDYATLTLRSPSEALATAFADEHEWILRDPVTGDVLALQDKNVSGGVSTFARYSNSGEGWSLTVLDYGPAVGTGVRGLAESGVDLIMAPTGLIGVDRLSGNILWEAPPTAPTTSPPTDQAAGDQVIDRTDPSSVGEAFFDAWTTGDLAKMAELASDGFKARSQELGLISPGPVTCGLHGDGVTVQCEINTGTDENGRSIRYYVLIQETPSGEYAVDWAARVTG